MCCSRPKTIVFQSQCFLSFKYDFVAPRTDELLTNRLRSTKKKTKKNILQFTILLFEEQKIGKMPHKAELERTKQELAQALAEIDKIGKCAKDIVSRDLLPLFFFHRKLI